LGALVFELRRQAFLFLFCPENLLEVIRKVCCASGVDSVVSNSCRISDSVFPTAVVLVAGAAFTPTPEVKGLSPFFSLPVPFPATGKAGEGKMFPSVPLCVMFPRGSNTD
jgi:hypothetical protein